MPRPRLHDPDIVLDAVEALAARSGPAAVSIRAISAEVGASNGALYHTFASRGGLMAHAWLRAGRRFLAVQTALVDQAGAQLGEGAGVDAVVAAADAPVIFAQKFPDSGALLLSVRRQDVLAGDVPDETASELRELDKLLVNLMVCLAIEMWDRKDAAAVEVITACIVDLPTALLLRRGRLGSASARAQLHAAVRAVLAVGPTPPRRRRADPPLTPPQKGKLRDA